LWNKLDSFHVDYADPDATGLGSGDGVVTRSEFTNGILSMPLSTFCDYFENTANTHGSNFFEGTGLCQKTVGKIPEPFGYFPNDGSHGFVVSVSDTPCTDQEGCPTETDNNTTICELRLHRTSGGLAQVDCGGAVGKYVQLSLPGTGNRLLPADVDVTVHRSSVPLDLGPNTTFEEAIASTNPALKTVCYGVLPRKVPAANDPDLLANAKLHPKTIVDDNPEDPIFWSTCYDRVVIREWLPLLNEAGAREDTNATLEYSFKQGEQCLACDSLRNNHLSEYNMTTMATPRWWLQAEGECVDCNREFFPEMYPPCTCTNGTAAMWQYGGCDVAGAEDCSACNAGYTLNGQVCDANICTCTGGTAAIATDGSCDVSNAEDCTACNAGYTLNGQVCDEAQDPAGPEYQVNLLLEFADVSFENYNEAAVADELALITGSYNFEITAVYEGSLIIEVAFYFPDLTEANEFYQDVPSIESASLGVATVDASAPVAITTSSVITDLAFHDDASRFVTSGLVVFCFLSQY
jgi:hypothetical protein